MTFLRQRWKQKPRQYGPFSRVRSSLLRNAKAIGLSPDDALPLFECAGKTFSNYGFRAKADASIAGDYNNGLDDSQFAWIDGSPAFLYSGDPYYGYNIHLETDRYDKNSGLFHFDVTLRPYAGIEARSLLSGDTYNAVYIDSLSSIKVTLNNGATTHAYSFDENNKRYIISVMYWHDGTNSHRIVIVNGDVLPEQTATRPASSAGAITWHNNWHGGYYNRSSELLLNSVLLQYQTTPTINQVQSLHDNPWGIWQKVSPISYFLPTAAAGGSTLNSLISWKIRTVKESASAWRVLNQSQQDSGWKLLTQSNVDSSWKVLTELSEDAAWKILNSNEADTAWSIVKSDSSDTAWSVKSSAVSNVSWKTFNGLGVDTAWKILMSGILSQDTAWKILNSNNADTSWKIFNKLDNDTAWRILTSGLLSQETSWKILMSKNAVTGWQVKSAADTETAWKIATQAQQDSSWKISTSAGQDTAWKILTGSALAQDLSWKILRVDDQELAWNLLAQAEEDTAWKIVTSADQDTAWGILTDDIPEAVYMFNAKARTFIFFKK